MFINHWKKIIISFFIFIFLITLAFAGFVFYQKFTGRALIPTVQAGEGYVPVSLPISIEFPYSGAKPEDIKNNFSITPEVQGMFYFNGKILTLDHEKNLKYNTTYTVKVAKGLEIGWGQKLQEDFILTFSTRPRGEKRPLYLTPYARFQAYNLNYYDDQYELSFSSYHEGGTFTFKVYKSSADKLLEAFFQPVEYDKEGDIVRKNYAEGEPLDTQVLQFDKEEKVFSPKISGIGVYFVDVDYQGENETEKIQEKYSFFLTLTKNTVNAKRLGDRLITWVVNQRASAGVESARVVALGGSDGKTILFDEKTNGKGLLEKNIDQKENDKKPRILKIEDGNDVIYNFLSFEWQWDVYTQDYNNRLKSYQAYIYTDRPIYRPGDKVNFKTILRDASGIFYQPAKQKEVVIKAEEFSYGENRNTIFEKKILTNENGSLADSFDLSKELKSGEYQLTVESDEDVLARTSFNVEFYQKPDFEILVSLDKEKYIKGESIKAKISSHYFFGDPLKGEKVKWRIYTFNGSTEAENEGNLDEAGNLNVDILTEDLSLPDWDYWWYGEDSNPGFPVTVEASITDKSGKVSTGIKTAAIFRGEYSISLLEPENLWGLKTNNPYRFLLKVQENLSRDAKSNLPLKIKLAKSVWSKNYEHEEDIIKEAELVTNGFGESEFEVNFPSGGSYHLLVSTKDNFQNELEQKFYFWVSEDSLAGIRQNKKDFADKILVSLDKKSYKIGDVAKIDLQLPRTAGDIFLSVNKEIFKKWAVERIDGYKKRLEIPITEDLVPGFYFYADLFQDDIFIEARQLIEVTGKKLKVEVNPAKAQAGPGEDFEIILKTVDENGNPVSADGSMGVIDKAIFALKSDQTANIFDSFYPQTSDWLRTTDSLKVVAPSMAEMGCFLAGTKILMHDGTYKNIEEIKVGDYVLTKENDVSSKMVSDKVLRVFEHLSNEYLIVTHEKGQLRVTDIHPILVNDVWKDASEIKIGDKLLNSQNEKVKVLSIAEVKVEKPVRVYNFQTLNYHTFFADGIYAHNQCAEKGGAGASCPVRANFVDTAYWNAFVQTDQNGEAKISFKLPDNLTTWVAFSRVITEDTKVGQGSGEFKVTKDLIIRPVLPQFFRNGDSITIISTVHNNLGKSAKFKVSLKVEGAEIIDKPIKDLEAVEGEVKNVSWKLRVGKDKTSKLIFYIEEVGGNAKDGVELNVPVYPNLSSVKKVISGTGAATVNFKYEPEISRAYSTASFSLVPSVVGILPEVIEKLTGYPYGCVEQTMTKHLPNILVFKEKDALSLKAKDDFQKNLTEGFDRLAKFQHDDGGFGWWESDENNVWMSGYVLEGIYEAKEAGLLGGREGMYNRLLDYLKKNVAGFNDEERVYITYVLSKVEPGGNQTWTEKFADEFLGGKQFDVQSQGYIALGLYNNGDIVKSKAVMTKVLTESKDGHWEMAESYDYHGALKDQYSATGVNLLALLKIDAKNEVIPKIVQWLMNNRNGYEGLWGSTRQSAQILLALVEYLKASDELNPDFVYDAYLNGELLRNDQVNNKNYNIKLTIPVGKMKDNNILEVKQKGKGNIYWSLTLNNYLPGDKISGGSPKITITREYLDLKDNKISKFIPGSLVKVRLKVKNEEMLRYVILEDYLPAAFEPQNMRLDNVSGRAKLGNMYFGEWYDNQDIRDEKVAIFRSALWPSKNYQWSGGEHYFEYMVRVNQSGSFEAPSPRLELMYSPEIFGIGESAKVLVE